MVTLVIGMLQGSSVARLCVENLGLPKNKEIKNPSKTKTKHQTKIKTRLRIFLIEKGYFLHCIYQRDHSDVANSSGAKLFIFFQLFIDATRKGFSAFRQGRERAPFSPVTLPGRAKSL